MLITEYNKHMDGCGYGKTLHNVVMERRPTCEGHDMAITMMIMIWTGERERKKVMITNGS